MLLLQTEKIVGVKCQKLCKDTDFLEILFWEKVSKIIFLKQLYNTCNTPFSPITNTFILLLMVYHEHVLTVIAT